MNFREEQFGALTKWTLEDHPFPFTPMFHKIMPDRGEPHDHPFAFNTFILHGGYTEEVYDLETGHKRYFQRNARDSLFVESGVVHRIVATHYAEPCYTMILPNGIDRTWAHYEFRKHSYVRKPHDGSSYQIRFYRDQ